MIHLILIINYSYIVHLEGFLNPFQDRVSIWSIHWIDTKHFYDQFLQFIRVTLSHFFIGPFKDSSLVWL